MYQHKVSFRLCSFTKYNSSSQDGCNHTSRNHFAKESKKKKLTEHTVMNASPLQRDFFVSGHWHGEKTERKVGLRPAGKLAVCLPQTVLCFVSCLHKINWATEFNPKEWVGQTVVLLKQGEKQVFCFCSCEQGQLEKTEPWRLQTSKHNKKITKTAFHSDTDDTHEQAHKQSLLLRMLECQSQMQQIATLDAVLHTSAKTSSKWWETFAWLMANMFCEALGRVKEQPR